MLPESQRLRNRRDFRLVYSRGRSFVNPMLVLYARPTGQGPVRVGFSISKKVGGAVDRNRIKRRLRVIMRAHAAKLRPGHDVVLVGRTRLKDATFREIQATVQELLRRAKLLDLSDVPPAPEA